MIAARQIFLGRRAGGLTGYTRIPSLMITDEGDASYLDTGVSVPQSGDMIIECDYLSSSKSKYVILGGANGTSLTGQGFSIRGYASYKQMYYYTAMWNRRFMLTRISYPISVSGGVVGDEEYIEINGAVMTHPLNGEERGTASNHTFTFGRSANANDDFSGTIIGPSRIKLAGDVVWNGLPVLRDSDGAVGFYDIIGKSFHPANANFAVGPEIQGASS